MPKSTVLRALYIAIGTLFLALALVGILLPLLPTVPFLLLAGFFFARSSPKLLNWLLRHPRLGPPIADWRDKGTISRRSKIMASLSIAASLLLTLYLGFGVLVLVLQGVVLTLILIFIWSRPPS